MNFYTDNKAGKRLLYRSFVTGAAVVLLTSSLCLTGCKKADSEVNYDDTASQTEGTGDADIDLGSPDENVGLPVFGYPLDEKVDIDLLGNPDQYIHFNADYKNIEGSNDEVEVSEEDIQDEIDYLISNAISYQDVSDRKSMEGDKMVADIIGTVEDNVLVEEEECELIIGSSQFPELDDALVGLAVGDDVKIEIDYPEDFGDEELDGQTMVYEITIYSLQKPISPEYNDAFVEKQTGYKTTGEYEEHIRQMLLETNQQTIVENWIGDHVEMENCPDEIYQKYEARLLETYEMFASTMGVTMEDVLAGFGFDSQEEFLASEDTKNSIRANIMTEMAYNSIAISENLIPNYGELEKYADSFAKEEMGLTDARELLEMYDVEEILNFYCQNKAVKKLLEYCTFK